MTTPDHVPTLRFIARCIHDDIRDSQFDGLTGDEAATAIAKRIEEAAEREEDRQDDSQGLSAGERAEVRQRWHESRRRADSEYA
ncbi:hypothetical protein FHX42_001264 [Saccharopolyspora lacisalsi]|uniref:Uncharacterized protein n=1 Tax=Halosaccharopolyspora lacisalsi TaxID=1000566 RepID=A0A839DX52_9PSEU|nr:hypothetical protein [Halosaccharopolyspora lacisalsi]MBA8823935.1 hypothetical protein [Halosaccharopolyspora lacisalsi]